MIDTIAKRRIRLNGTLYQKGDTVPMPAAQFADLEPTGMVERAPKPKAEKATPSKSSVAAD